MYHLPSLVQYVWKQLGDNTNISIPFPRKLKPAELGALSKRFEIKHELCILGHYYYRFEHPSKKGEKK